MFLSISLPSLKRMKATAGLMSVGIVWYSLLKAVVAAAYYFLKYYYT